MQEADYILPRITHDVDDRVAALKLVLMYMQILITINIFFVTVKINYNYYYYYFANNDCPLSWSSTKRLRKSFNDEPCRIQQLNL